MSSGTCVDGFLSFSCICTEGRIGDRCQCKLCYHFKTNVGSSAYDQASQNNIVKSIKHRL